jgi:hypothetical protein
MTTYATMNPVGSTAVKDLYDNAQNLDSLMLGPAEYYPDRLGKNRISWKGIENQFASFLMSSGYEVPVPYVAGILVTRPTQTFSYLGEVYRPKVGAIPFTTTTFAADSDKLLAMGDSALRQDLSSADLNKGVAMVKGAPRIVANLAALKALPKTGSQTAYMRRTGFYTYDPADTTTAGDNATVVVATDGGRWKLDYLTHMDLRQFGAALDGATDDTAAVQAWLNFLQISGCIGTGCGKARVTSTLFILKPISISGAIGALSIQGAFADGDIISVGTVVPGTLSGGVNISGLEITSLVTKTSGYNLNLIASYNTKIDKLIVSNGFNHIGLTGAPSQSIHISNIESANAKNFHFDCQNVSADVTVDNWYAHGQGPANQSVAGANITQAGDVTLSRFNTAYCGTDVLITPGNGQRVQALYITHCFLDTAIGYGVYAVPTGTGKIDLLSISHNWISTHNQGGVLSGGDTGSVKQIDIFNNQICNNLLHGIFINVGTLRANIGNNTCAANGNSGLAVAGGVNNIRVNNNTLDGSGEFGPNAQWGMLVAAGTGANHLITNNSFQTTGAGGLFNGATGANRISYPNIGGSGALKPLSIPAVDWGIDFTEAGAGLQAVAAGASYVMQVGSGMLAVADDATGAMAVFLCYAGNVVKIAGDASIVAGGAAANQIGVSFAAGNYRIGNGYAVSKNLVISSIKMRQAS